MTLLIALCAFVVGFGLSASVLYFPLLRRHNDLRKVVLQGLDNQIALLKQILGVKEQDGSMVSPIQINKLEE